MFLMYRLKVAFLAFFGIETPKKISTSMGDGLEIDEELINDNVHDSDVCGNYKQRGLYKNNPMFVVTIDHPYSDNATGYILYQDGVKSPTYTLPKALLETFFRKV